MSADPPRGANGSIRQPVWRSLAIYYLWAVSISWIAWAPLILGKTGLGVLPIAIPMPWVIPGTAGPLIAAMIVQWRECHNLRVGRLCVPWRRGVLGGLAAIIFLAVTFVIGTASIMTVKPPQGWDLAAPSLYRVNLIATFAAGPMFEEWGWRGFAQARLQNRISPIGAAIVVGAGQGLWHLPLFLIPTWSSAPVFTYVAMVISLSVILAWGFNLSGRSILVAIILHAVFNASSRVLGGFLGTAELRSWPDGVSAILLALVIAAITLAFATRGRLALANRES